MLRKRLTREEQIARYNASFGFGYRKCVSRPLKEARADDIKLASLLAEGAPPLFPPEDSQESCPESFQPKPDFFRAPLHCEAPGRLERSQRTEPTDARMPPRCSSCPPNMGTGSSESSTDSEHDEPHFDAQASSSPPPEPSAWTPWSDLLPSESAFLTSTSALLALAKQCGKPVRNLEDFTPWQKVCRLYDRALKRLEEISAKGSAAVLRSRDVLDLVEKIENLAGQLFRSYAMLLGIHILNDDIRYVKADFDTAMEQCFGSMTVAPTWVFDVPGLAPQPARTHDQAQRVFSLYLGRKVFCPASPAKMKEAHAAFVQRVSVPAPDHPDRAIFVRLVRSVAQALFSIRIEDEVLNQPTHSAACIERQRSAGGKRDQYWLNDPCYDTTKTYVYPQTIYTGGKPRTITIDSAFNMIYAHWNQWMARRIRMCRWSVFGRSVEEWLAQNPGFLDLKLGEEFVSGDLKSATDLFCPELADAVLEELASRHGLSAEDLTQMKSFTTHAAFVKKFKGNWIFDFMQKRGQLMGSVLSFPILCIVSFCCGIWKTEAHEAIDRVQREASAENAVSWLRRFLLDFGGVGINGDDIVFKATDDGAAWEDGVEAAGGETSRGKSLKSRHSFTVNSELWTDLDGHWKPPSALRPSIVCRLADDTRRVPAHAWVEFERCSLVGMRLKHYLDMERILKVNLPRAWGGLNLVRRFDAAFCLANRPPPPDPLDRVRPARAWSDYVAPLSIVRRCVLPKVDLDSYRASETLATAVTSGGIRFIRAQWSLSSKQSAPPETNIEFLNRGELETLEKEYHYYFTLGTEGKKVALVNVLALGPLDEVPVKVFYNAGHRNFNRPDVSLEMLPPTSLPLTLNGDDPRYSSLRIAIASRPVLGSCTRLDPDTGFVPRPQFDEPGLPSSSSPLTSVPPSLPFSRPAMDDGWLPSFSTKKKVLPFVSATQEEAKFRASTL